jgi:hypothetical protein
MERSISVALFAICAATFNAFSACAEKSVGTKIRFIIRWIKLWRKFGILMLHKDKKYFTAQINSIYKKTLYLHRYLLKSR